MMMSTITLTTAKMFVISEVAHNKYVDNDGCIKVDCNNDYEDGNEKSNRLQQKICRLNKPSCYFIKSYLCYQHHFP